MPRTEEENIRFRKSVEHCRERYKGVQERLRAKGVDLSIDELPSSAWILKYVKPDSINHRKTVEEAFRDGTFKDYLQDDGETTV